MVLVGRLLLLKMAERSNRLLSSSFILKRHRLITCCLFRACLMASMALFSTVSTTRAARQLKTIGYPDCDLILEARGVQSECGHQIQPSGIAYLPTHRRLIVVGQEYILHASEDEDGGFFIEGCYKGRQGSLGRGDIECVASLDFALSKPPDTAHPQIQENWRRLKALDTHVLVMEENYFSKTAYLVDTTKLGNGKHGDTAATVVKFGIPIYPSHLEGLAFVPDLSDDIHLGTVFLGSQRGDVVACKLPLGDLVSDKNVTCTGHPTLFRHSIDSMEFDPTFQVMPGKFGALVIGSDPVGKAVYVDPWRLQNGEVLTWSEEFRLRSEAVDGHPMYGREGHAIHGNRSFYALDDNRHNNRGVVVCDISNKPVSTAQNVTGWHASDPGSSSALQLESEPQPEKDNSRLQIVDETQQNTGITAMSGNGNTPAALLAPFDLSRLDESGMISRWGLLSGPVDCDSLCQREKGVMSMLFPHVAIHLRCRDGDQGENMNQVAYGCTGLVGSSQAIEAAKRSHNETIEDWNMWVTAGDQICGKKCSAAKSSICAAKPELCEQLRCNDLWLGREEPGRTEQQCKLVSRPQVTRVPTPLLLTHQQMDSRWRAHGIEECGPACQADKHMMCLARPRDCWALRCKDIAHGLIQPVLDCSKKPPNLPEQLAPHGSEEFFRQDHGYCTYGDCNGISNGDNWCQASMGNCAVGCMGKWCFKDRRLEPILPIKQTQNLPTAVPEGGATKDSEYSLESHATTASPNMSFPQQESGPANTQLGIQQPTPNAPSSKHSDSALLDDLGFCSWSRCSKGQGGVRASGLCHDSPGGCAACGGEWCHPEEQSPRPVSEEAKTSGQQALPDTTSGSPTVEDTVTGPPMQDTSQDGYCAWSSCDGIRSGNANCQKGPANCEVCAGKWCSISAPLDLSSSSGVTFDLVSFKLFPSLEKATDRAEEYYIAKGHVQQDSPSANPGTRIDELEIPMVVDYDAFQKANGLSDDGMQLLAQLFQGLSKGKN